MTDLLTSAQVAERLHVSERTLRRMLPRVSGLAPLRIGRKLLFSATELARIEDAFRCPLPSVNAEMFGMHEERFASAIKPSRSGNTAQDVVRAEMLRLKQAAAKQRLERKSLLGRKAARESSP